MRAILALAVLLAGCMSPSSTTSGSDAAAPALGALSFEGCEQTHTFAPYPVEAFAGMLPEGWELQPADPAGRTTQLYLAGSLCATAMASTGTAGVLIEDLKEVWGYLFVVPPNGTDEAYAVELWPLGGIVSHGDALDVYASWGFGDLVVQGETEIALSTPAAGIVSSRTWASGAGETFEVNAGARGEPAPFHDGAFRVWIPGEEGPVGAFAYAWGADGTDLGLGPGTLRYGGPFLNAPPVGPVLVHHVRDVSGNATRLE